MKIAGVGEHERFLAYKAGHARKNLRTTEIYRYRILEKKEKKKACFRSEVSIEISKGRENRCISERMLCWSFQRSNSTKKKLLSPIND